MSPMSDADHGKGPGHPTYAAPEPEAALPDPTEFVHLGPGERVDGETRDCYVRQLHDWKGGSDPETLRVPGASLHARMCGSTLARAHAHWGDRIAIASYLGGGDAFPRAIADFSAAYDGQNERDFETFAAAVKSGRLPAEMGL